MIDAPLCVDLALRNSAGITVTQLLLLARVVQLNICIPTCASVEIG